MCCVAVLILTTFFAVTVGQVSIVTDKNNVQDGDSVVLTCTAPDFTDNIFIIQDSTNRAFCFASSACSTNTSLYSAVKSGTNIVTFTILSFLKERDEGLWKIRYATSTDSEPLTLSGFKDSTSSSGGLSGGKIAGIVIGGVAGLLFVLVAFLVYKFKLAQPHVRSLLPDERSKQEAKIGSQVELLNKLCKLKQHIHSVKWIYDNEPVVVGEKYKGGTTNCPSLTIRCVSQEDFGLWKCILETKNSEQTFFVQLISKDSGYPTLGNLPPFEN